MEGGSAGGSGEEVDWYRLGSPSQPIEIFSLSVCIEIPLPLRAPPVTLSMTTDLRGKCKVPPHQEIKILASSHCLTPLTSLVFPHPFHWTFFPHYHRDLPPLNRG
ncbi:unnamed protein product [Pleuronectes platessa]|uniref:Uncharacterized protein n=1 Tax=Pleuronectes platessa TaxID=8262 RepID=A0A9N7TSD9_PLEPL|nr:unnamed protein product [Pleuronectes platessa]